MGCRGSGQRAGEISCEIDTDKSSTLRLPGRLRSAEEAAGSESRKWPGASLKRCLQHVAKADTARCLQWKR